MNLRFKNYNQEVVRFRRTKFVQEKESKSLANVKAPPLVIP